MGPVSNSFCVRYIGIFGGHCLGYILQHLLEADDQQQPHGETLIETASKKTFAFDGTRAIISLLVVLPFIVIKLYFHLNALPRKGIYLVHLYLNESTFINKKDIWLLY